MAVLVFAVQPGEAWRMTPRQWWDLYDFKLLQGDPKRAAAEAGPRMSRAEFDALEKQLTA